MAEWSWGVSRGCNSVPRTWICDLRSPTLLVMVRGESEKPVAGVSKPDSAIDSPRDDRVASVEETMRVARILATRHVELLRRLA